MKVTQEIREEARRMRGRSGAGDEKRSEAQLRVDLSADLEADFYGDMGVIENIIRL